MTIYFKLPNSSSRFCRPLANGPKQIWLNTGPAAGIEELRRRKQLGDIQT
jgi:hypothetical protein